MDAQRAGSHPVTQTHVQACTRTPCNEYALNKTAALDTPAHHAVGATSSHTGEAQGVRATADAVVVGYLAAGRHCRWVAWQYVSVR